MRISAESDYACRALLELSLKWQGKCLVQVSIIAEKQGIPIKYLEQILLQLKNAGLINSVRGKYGGYKLAKSPAEISLAEVLRRIKGPILQVSDTAARKESVFSGIWKEIEGSIVKILENINFEDIANKAKGMEGVMSYQI